MRRHPRRATDCDAGPIQWRVVQFRSNRSAFNGYRETPSSYSELQCQACGATWRTNAGYVSEVPHGKFNMNVRTRG